MATAGLKKLVVDCPGESAGTIERFKELGMGKPDLNAQSIVLEGPDRERVSCLIPDGKHVTAFFEDVQTLYDVFQRGLKLSRDSNCLGWRSPGENSYKWLSYDEVYKRVHAFGSGLIKSGIPAGQGTKLGIFSKNRVEWSLTEQASNMFSMILVPLYDTLGQDACKIICKKAELEVVICEKENQVLMLVDFSNDIPDLKTIIVMDEVSEEVEKEAKEKGISLRAFHNIEEDGSIDLHEHQPPKPEDISTICFTSGTTGIPKGVILTHGNIVAGMNSLLAGLGDQFEFRTGDVHFSYLPLAHIYERFNQAIMFMHGASIGCYQGDAKLLLDDLACLKATIFPCVPRVMNKLYEVILAGVSEKNILVQKIFFKALQEKKKEIARGTVRNNGLWDIVFKKIRMKTGGRVRLITTGAAPIGPDVKSLIRAIFGCLLLEGYGQTETSGPVSMNFPSDLTDNHVGAILPSITVKLVDAPDLEYFASNDQGEICVEGGTIFQGYYKDPEKTAETIDADGYHHTGDIGEWLPNGQLKIIDRIKHIFKLSQGEYVAPEIVENEYLRAESVGQIFVHGHSVEDCCVAIVVPNEDWVTKVAKQRQWEGDFKTLCEKQELRDLVFANMNDFAKRSELKGFEKVQCITLHSELFSLENGFLTPTFKSKRPVLRKFFEDKVTSMYAELAEQKRNPHGSGRAVNKKTSNSSANSKHTGETTKNGSVETEAKLSKDEENIDDGDDADPSEKSDDLKENGSVDIEDVLKKDEGDEKTSGDADERDELVEDVSMETNETKEEKPEDEDKGSNKDDADLPEQNKETTGNGSPAIEETSPKDGDENDNEDEGKQKGEGDQE